MRVCMVTYSFYEGDTRVIQYATALAERGDRVDVLALRKPGDLRFEVLRGVNVFRIQERKVNEKSRFLYLFRILRFLVASALLIAKNQFFKRYDVIHVHSVPDFLIFAAIAPKLLGAHIILDIHDILPEFYAAKFGASRDSFLFQCLAWVEKVSIAFSDHVIVANHLWYGRLVSRSVAAEKCTVVINYPDPQLFAPREKCAADGKFIILYPGSLNQHQGLEVAIRAFARVAGQMAGAEFHIYGEGPAKPALIGLANGLGLPGRVIFHDALPAGEIAEIMAGSDLAVVPKRASSAFGNEAASTKIMEFMALRVPLIVSNTKIDTFYHDATRVRFFESENEADLAKAMLQLWRRPELRAQLVAGASRYIEQNSWKERKRDYLDLVDRLHVPPQAAPKANGARKNLSQIKSMTTFRLDRAISVGLVHPVAHFLRRRRSPRIPILMYHGLRSEIGSRHPYYETNISRELFAAHMKFLHENGYTTANLNEALEAMMTGRNSEKRVVLTFDDGFRDFYAGAYPILSEYNFKATLFIVTGLTGNRTMRAGGNEYMTWPEVREIHARGIQIGSHSVTHPELYRMTPNEVEREVRQSKETIEDELGEAIRSFSYPYAFPEQDKEFTARLQEMLETHGYENGVCTTLGTAKASDNWFFLPRLPVNSFDDLRLLHAKLEGGYDWLRVAQKTYKNVIKRFLESPAHF